MGPRSKSRLEYTSCSSCECVFSIKDKEKHNGVCGYFVKFTVCYEQKLPHGFIKANTLTAVAKTEDPPKHLPKNFHNDVVLLHQVAMQLIGVGLGSPVIVSGDPENDPCPRVLKAWPISNREVTSIGFVNCITPGLQPTQTSGVTSVKALNTPHQSAQTVCIKTREHKTYLQSQEFLDYAHRWCDGRFLTKGNKIHLTYYGQPCQLEVVKIKGEEDQCVQNIPEKPAQNLSDKLSQDVTNSLAFDVTDNLALDVTDNLAHDVTDKLAQDVTDNLAEDLADKLAQVSLDTKSAPEESCTKFFRVVKASKFVIDEDLNEDNVCRQTSNRTLSLDQLGGLKNQVEKLRELIDLHFKSNSPTQQGLSLPKGILLYGPSGTGKTLLAQALINYAGVHTVEIQGTELWSRFYGESETRLASKFQEAKDCAPSIIFIDEVDTICPKRQNSQNEVEKRVVSSLMTLMDKTLSAEKPVIVVAATNKREEVDPALRRPGRLEREVEIGVPSATERSEILQSLLLNTTHTLSGDDVKSVADQAHGFVGADLAAVCKEAGILALKRLKSEDVKIESSHVLAALQTTQPSAMREVALEITQVSWGDIGGQKELKHKLRQAIEWPLRHPDSFLRLGIRPPRGLLMYGPPGCSKTMIAKALAHESGLNFIAIKGPELFSKWVGESERAVREVFRKARAAAPAIIFFDEIDSIAGERGSHGGSGGGEVGDRVLAQLLTEMDGVVALQDVTIVAATNRPERIDKALLRPGRLDRIVYVPLPDAETRTEIFKIHFKKTQVAEDVDVKWLVEKTHRYSGAEVSAVCHEAALSAMQEDIGITQVYKRHFETALSTVTPRISPEVIQAYDNYARNSGLHSL